MGTRFTIVLYAGEPATANRALSAAFARIDELNRRLTDYDEQSELNRLCQQSAPTSGDAKPRPVAVSHDLWRVLEQAMRVSRASDGAFDVTVGRLTRMWRRSRRRQQLPTHPMIHEARRSIGYRQLRLDPVSRTVELRLPGMQLDLGGIAKGFAADQALVTLRHHGVESAMVNAGGEIVAAGPPPDSAGWKVVIASIDQSDPRYFVQVSHAAVATSGDTWQYLEIDGVRYSHIVDPKTGVGITARRQATVLAADGTTADALASALVALPPDRGLAFAQQWPMVEALVVELIDGQPRPYLTHGMAHRLITLTERHARPTQPCSGVLDSAK